MCFLLISLEFKKIIWKIIRVRLQLGKFFQLKIVHLKYFSCLAEVDISFMNASPEFSSSERSASNQSVQDSRQNDAPCGIIDLAPEWSYCEVNNFSFCLSPFSTIKP